MKKLLFVFQLFLATHLSAQIQNSHFGASMASPLTDNEGWSNFQDLGVHYIRFPFDIKTGMIVDNFFFQHFDSLVNKAQAHELIMYGIINPKKNQSDNWPSITEFTTALKKIVERYDGDGVSDMPGLTYSITNWEICNEIRWDTDCVNDPNCSWKNFGKTNYLIFMDSTRTALTSTCANCHLFNGAQINPPSLEISTFGYSSLKTVIDSLSTNSIDGISYHNYLMMLQSSDAMTDFTTIGIQDKPIFATEADMQNEYNLNNSLSQDDNARMLAQSFVSAFKNGFDKIFYTAMRAPTDVQDFVKWGSLLDPETGMKRKSFWVLKKMIEEIDYFDTVTTASPHNGTTVYAYKFTVNGKYVYVLWANSNQTVNLTLSGTNVTDVNTTLSVPNDTIGNFTTNNIAAASGIASISIGQIPIYVDEVISTDLQNPNSSKQLKIYSNPATNKIIVESNNIPNSKILIYTMQGELLLKENITTNRQEINISKLLKGSYLLKYIDDEITSSKIFIKK